MNPKDDLLNLMHHRQHHPSNMTMIIALIRRHLPLPLPEDDNYIDALIYFSQISQAMVTKIETEVYRSLRDTEHHTMGALYWQLNDVWVAPSWSSIDFYGNFKVSVHGTVFFSKLISPFHLFVIVTPLLGKILYGTHSHCSTLRLRPGSRECVLNL